MKTLQLRWFILTALVFGLAGTAFSQGTTFMYHGRLNDNGGPANGNYDLTFSVFEVDAAGHQVGSTLTNAYVGVTNGLFTTLLDFGPGTFTGPDRWLELGVRTNGVGDFTPLSPRHRLTPTPYAIMANTASNLLGSLPVGQLVGMLAAGQLPGNIPRLDGNANFTGTVSLNNPANSFTGNGSGLTNLSASQFTSGTLADGRLSANVSLLNAHQTFSGSNTFKGVLNATNVANRLVGTFIGDGSGLTNLPVGVSNAITGTYSSIAGGIGNSVRGTGGFVGGGSENFIGSRFAVIAGGNGNLIFPFHDDGYGYEVIGGGMNNLIADGWASFIGGGRNNFVANEVVFGTIAGGDGNNINRVDFATISGGGNNRIEHSGLGDDYASIGGGGNNYISTTGPGATIAGGMYNTISASFESTDGVTIGGGWGNLVTGSYGTIAGGQENSIAGRSSGATIAGGSTNSVLDSSSYGTIAGGAGNSIGRLGASEGETSDFGTISGGADNRIGRLGASEGDYEFASPYGTISGGIGNSITGTGTNGHEVVVAGTIGGGSGNTIIATVFHSTIGGGADNLIGGQTFASTIAGGGRNTIKESNGGTIGGGRANSIPVGEGATIAGGYFNVVSTLGPHTFGGTIGGGQNNYVFDENGTIAGGANNLATNKSAAVGGGVNNTAGGLASIIAGGSDNIAGSDYATVGGGTGNCVNGSFGVIPGGLSNVATNFGFATGRRAKALHTGSLVWADSNDLDFASTTTNEFSVRSTGGARFVSAIAADGITIAGVELVAGGGSWSSLSDRNAKENFAAINPREILERVNRMPITTWNYKSQDAAIRHMGPMAQDFAAAFQVGENDRRITTVDADGVALAAIQGLNQKLEEKEAEIQSLHKRLEVLERAILGRETALNGSGQ